MTATQTLTFGDLTDALVWLGDAANQSEPATLHRWSGAHWGTFGDVPGAKPWPKVSQQPTWASKAVTVTKMARKA